MSENTKTETIEEPPSLEIDEAVIEEVQQEDLARSTSPEKRSGGAGFLAFLAMLLAAGGIAAGYYVYDKEIKPLTRLSGKLDEVREFTASRQAVEELRQQLQQVQADNQALQADLSRAGGDFQTLAENVEQLRRRAGFGQREWQLAEIAYLLNIAKDRLQYLHDSKTAAAALQDALNRIDAMADPRLAPLRHQIFADLQAVSAWQPVDADQVLQKLTAIAAALQPLPEAPEAEQAVAEPPSKPLKEKGLKDLWSSFKQSLANRVRVVKHDEPLNALEQQHVAGHQIGMLKLQIEILRLALLRGDMDGFRQQLQRLAVWAEEALPPQTAEAIRNEVTALEQYQPPSLPRLQASVADFMTQARQSPPAEFAAPPPASPQPEMTGFAPSAQEQPETAATSEKPEAAQPQAPTASPEETEGAEKPVEAPAIPEATQQEAAPEELIRLQEMLDKVDAMEAEGAN